MASIILGNNIDTFKWIEFLKNEKHEDIIVVDYEYTGKPKIYEDVIYISYLDGENYLKNFHTVKFFKSMYIYPGMMWLRSISYEDENDST